MPERNTAIAKSTEAAAPNAVALPPSAEKLDRALVDRAAAHIRDVAAKTLTRGLEEVGRYLLREFYDDDPAAYLSLSPTKHASLSVLVERCESMELPVSRTFLANALRLAAVTKNLPTGSTFQRLPPSHRVELLRVRASDKLEKLATKAVDGNLSVQKLRALVQKEVHRDKNAQARGRKRGPQLQKALDACLRALRHDNGKIAFQKSDATDMTAEDRAKVEAALKALEKRIAEIRKLLG